MRPTRDQWAMELAKLCSARTTCLRRAVGCVILNARGHVLSTGYNGVAASQPHCNETSQSGYVVPFDINESAESMMAKLERDIPDVVGKYDRDTAWLEPYPGGTGGDRTVLKYEYRPHACSGATSPSGTNIDGCEAVHAEQNALLQCRDVYEIDTIYVTTSPCTSCVKLLLNTSCRRIVFDEPYPGDAAEKLWVRSGRVWEKFDSLE